MERRVVPFNELLSNYKLKFFYKDDLCLNKKQETIVLCLIQNGALFLMEAHMNVNAVVELLQHSNILPYIICRNVKGEQCLLN